ncbi:hypothetical protein GH714_033029 [Hevea brasiliensis]|uniref:Wall-associated receptor kinase galacturonan-binding domain-containing protein n=1 Tax=Hevea brasiliensis TaxID=3981 RepID=A0A6A6NA20_HEVBR|nr:hypothetical protein GH714_033029 [Hevea brasiliensis]
MVLQLESLLTVSVLQIMLEVAAVAATTTLAGRECEAKCGDIEIQYPFGIRADCSMDRWFVIDCIKTANSSKAFISSIKLELININYAHSRLLVKGPVFSYNCAPPNTGKAVNLRRTSFTFSAKNKFTVVGCNNRAFISSSEPDSIGCQPSCEVNVKLPGCTGYRCCQTLIPYFQQLFAPGFQDVDDDQCRIAFIVEKKWFKAYETDPYKVKDLEYVPVLLDWKINATALGSLVIDEESTYRDMIDYYDKFDFPYPNNTILLCREGFTGNPYLPFGCQDVNECEDPIVLSRCHGLCKNTYGSYKCVPALSWIIILAISAAATTLAGRGCEARCGDIDIQYPFGIRADCSMDKWFVIDCIKSANSSRAFISSINLELINIDYARSSLLVKGPVFSYNCTRPNTGQDVNLRRTSFTFSGSNKFTVVGCNNRASLSSSDPDGEGCQPTCEENVKPQGCFGNRCCQTSIPYFQQLLAPSFQDADDDQCRIAFIVEKKWFKANVKEPYKVQELEYVPVLLDWKIMQQPWDRL